MSKNFRFSVIFLIIIGVFIFFFWESDEKYLQKTTLKLLKLASVPVQDTNPVALLKRVEQIAKHIHFDVRFKLQVNGQTWENRSAGELRTLLLAYFQRGGLAQITVDNLSVRINSPGQSREDLPDSPANSSTSTGHVRFKAHGLRRENKVSCEVLLVWIQEKKWFIKEIEVFSCSPIPS